jgi:hypothetical protein
MNGPDLSSDLSKYQASRRPGIHIPPGIMPPLKWEEGKEKEGYVVCAPDGTVICKYPVERLFLTKFSDFFKERKASNSRWALMQFMEHLEAKGHGKKDEAQIHELAVHPFNVRYMPVERIDDLVFSHLTGLVEDCMLLNRLTVVRVDPDIVKILKNIAENARKRGLNPEDVLAGMLWRKVRLEGEEIVAREDDEIYSEVLRYCRDRGMKKPDGRIKYLIIDGYLRYVALCDVELKNVDSWKEVPKASVFIIKGGPAGPFVMDPISVSLYSIKANVSQRDLLTDPDPVSSFAKHFRGAGEVMMKLGNKLDLLGIAKTGKAVKVQSEAELLEAGPSEVEYYIGPIEETTETQTPAAEEERREERRWERREEPTARLEDVSAVQRQPAQTFVYAPAPPQTPVRTPLSSPMQPLREEAHEVSAPPRLESDFVLTSFLRMYGNVLPQIGTIVTEVGMRFSHRQLKMKEILGEGPKGSVLLLQFDRRKVKADGAEVDFSGILPFYFFKDGGMAKCPNCRAPIVLSPMRCLHCGGLIDRKELLPFPYEFSYKSD